eukprot:Gb_38473 [translate_table: standard]
MGSKIVRICGISHIFLCSLCCSFWRIDIGQLAGGDRRNSWPSVCGYFVSQMEMKEMFQGTSCGRYFGHVYLYYSPCALLLWWWELLLHLFGPKAQPLISTFLFICIFSPGTYKCVQAPDYFMGKPLKLRTLLKNMKNVEEQGGNT